MIHFQPSPAEFAELSRRANAIPVYCSLLSDQLTPVSAFERIGSTAKHAFLLESVVGGEKIARYSFLGADPVAVVESRDNETTVGNATGERTVRGVDPMRVLEDELKRFRTVHSSALPRFLGGAVGYAGYDAVRHYEKLGPPPPDDRHLPDVLFGIYDQMIVFDHVRKLVHVVVHAHLGPNGNSDTAYNDACSRITGIINRLSEPRADWVKPLIPYSPSTPIQYESSFTRQRFEDAVEKCKNYIRAGDIFQVVVSHRFTAITEAPPFDLYRALRVVNPSPFMFYVQSPQATLVGASPEILCRLEGRTVSTRPLAGTRPRGKTEAEDLGLETELLNDPKERAEHVMLVDLGRNDLGRVCEPGSVKIDDLMSIERYSHVMHICSNVSGTLSPDKTAFDALRSVLPVGTVSGAPKVRAMQIIDELEPVRRGPYAGAVGYIDFAGNMDTCIALRTLVITPETARGQGTMGSRDQGAGPTTPAASQGNRSWRADVQVGAGIVADSEPAREYQETVHKAQSMLSALHIANAWRAE
jgi:anthranilate synthase component 1